MIPGLQDLLLDHFRFHGEANFRERERERVGISRGWKARSTCAICIIH